MKRVAAVLVTALAVTGLAGCGASGPFDEARSYLAAWSKGDLAAAGQHTDAPGAATHGLIAARDGLRLAGVSAHIGHVDSHGDTGRAEFTTTLSIRGAGSWTYTGVLHLARAGGHWRVHWTPSDIHPMLTATTRLVLRRALPPRAALLDRHGTPLFTPQPVVQVGIEPQRLGTHMSATIATVARVVHVDATALTAAVHAAKPDAFVPVITLRRTAYDAVKPRIYNLPGTVFKTDTQLLPPTTGFARPLLGSVGPATADVLKAAGSHFAPGDVLGLSGLQEAFQQRLAGRATTSVVLEDPTGATIATLKTFGGAPGATVTTTLDIATQKAAEAALAKESKPAGLVAVRVSDGAILAAASTPDATSFDRALSGRYPPGSTFKVVTTYALLASGVTPTTTVACPPTITVDGKVFRNFEGETKSSAAFAEDFARSCNTAFIGASRRLHTGSLPDAARAFGVGAAWRLPLDAYSGSVPAPADAVEAAAEAIGQGRIQVSPLTMALVAAAVADGRPHPPSLVTDPAQPTAAPGAPLDPSRLVALRALMRRVVTEGTAATAHLPAGTYGKTGTAEFGTANPPKTHAWFLGYRGGIAFAVLVEGGGVGGQVAAPIAADFLRRLA